MHRVSRGEKKRRVKNGKGGSKRHRERKAAIWEETNGCCVYCGYQIAENLRTLDHIVPACQGGSWQTCNICPACRDCNEWRRDKMPASRFAHPAFLEYMLEKERELGVDGKISNMQPEPFVYQPFNPEVFGQRNRN